MRCMGSINSFAIIMFLNPNFKCRSTDVLYACQLFQTVALGVMSYQYSWFEKVNADEEFLQRGVLKP